MAVMELEELLVECLDALSAPAWDPRQRDGHIRAALTYARDPRTPAELSCLLVSVSDRLKALAHIQGFAFSAQEDDALVPELRRAVSDLRLNRYVYHGTAFGRLASIQKDGLVPGRLPVWRQKDVRVHAASAVFFEVSWRRAAWWAHVTSGHSRGPRAGKGRMPVVIRIPSNGLELRTDSRPRAGEALMVGGVVSVQKADVFVAPLHGIPT